MRTSPSAARIWTYLPALAGIIKSFTIPTWKSPISAVSAPASISASRRLTWPSAFCDLRKCGYSWPVLTLYKLIVTLDAPLQVAGKGLQYLWRRLRGRRAKAEKTLLALRGQLYFLVHGLVPFWRA